VGRDDVVGIATRYGLDGPGIESRLRKDFIQPFRPPMGPAVQWFIPWVEAAGATLCPPTSSAEVKERVELYICSPTVSS
jgi:hypothetical protein